MLDSIVNPKRDQRVRRSEAVSGAVYALAAAVVLCLFALFVATPYLQWLSQPAPKDARLDFRLPLSHAYLHGAMNGFTLVWFFAVGASFGSFMNVVTWRMPRGMNFVSQSSICPNCRHSIRGRHNLPVLGWITLGGRCLDCGSPISFRYPLVEILFGGVAFLLCLCELAAGGWTLPFHVDHHRYGLAETLWAPRWDLIGVFAFHCCLCVWLLTIGLFAHDEEATPKRFALFATVVAMSAVLLCPVLHPVGWRLEDSSKALPALWSATRLSGVVGLLASGLFALPGAFLDERRFTFPANYILASALIGAHLGWHAALSVLVIASLLEMIARCSSASVRSWPACKIACLLLATLLQIAAWRWLHQAQWQMGYAATTTWLLIAGAVLLAPPFIGRDQN